MTFEFRIGIEHVRGHNYSVFHSRLAFASVFWVRKALLAVDKRLTDVELTTLMLSSGPRVNEKGWYSFFHKHELDTHLNNAASTGAFRVAPTLEEQGDCVLGHIRSGLKRWSPRQSSLPDWRTA